MQRTIHCVDSIDHFIALVDGAGEFVAGMRHAIRPVCMGPLCEFVVSHCMTMSFPAISVATGLRALWIKWNGVLNSDCTCAVSWGFLCSPTLMLCKWPPEIFLSAQTYNLGQCSLWCVICLASTSRQQLMVSFVNKPPTFVVVNVADWVDWQCLTGKFVWSCCLCPLSHCSGWCTSWSSRSCLQITIYVKPNHKIKQHNENRHRSLNRSSSNCAWKSGVHDFLPLC